MVKFIETIKGETPKTGTLSILQAAEKFVKFCQDNFDPAKECEQKSEGKTVIFTAPNGDTLEMEFSSAEEREEMVGGE